MIIQRFQSSYPYEQRCILDHILSISTETPVIRYSVTCSQVAVVGSNNARLTPPPLLTELL